MIPQSRIDLPSTASAPTLLWRIFAELVSQVLRATTFASDGQGLPKKAGAALYSIMGVSLTAAAFRTFAEASPDNLVPLLVVGAMSYAVTMLGFWLITSRNTTFLSQFLCIHAGVDVFMAIWAFLGVETGMTDLAWSTLAMIVGVIRISNRELKEQGGPDER